MLLALALFLLGSCQKEQPFFDSSHDKDTDILVFSQKDQVRDFIKSFNSQEDPYQWKNTQNPTFTSLWDKYVLAEHEASTLESFEDADDFRRKWKDHIRILEDGSLEPMYELYFQNALVGENGIYKVGTEYRRLFRNGEAIAANRTLLEELTGSRVFDEDRVFPSGVRFEPVKITTQIISDSKRSGTLSDCTNSKYVNGKWHRTQGKLKGGLYNYDCSQFGGCPGEYIETFVEIVTKKQKKSWGIWVNNGADQIWGNGSLDFELNGTVFNSTYVSKFLVNSSTLFVSKSEAPFPGDHLDAEFGDGSGFHRAKRGSAFDRSCNTSY